MKRALILVDIQNDFLPGGSLAVPHGDEVIAVANRVQPLFNIIVASQDWHPPDHHSFAANHPGKHVGDRIKVEGLDQTLWPIHCVQNTKGAEFAPNLDRTRVTRVFHKGTDPIVDSYSTFYDNAHRKSTGLGEYLRELGVESVILLGLATDYCVKFSALDAIGLGLSTFVVKDGCRGVNLLSRDDERAWAEMEKAGVHLITSDRMVNHE